MTTRDRLTNIAIGCGMLGLAGLAMGTIWLYDQLKRLRVFPPEECG
jgi:hypothetical protein